MQLTRPRSLTGMILIGLALVALPLLVAIVRAALHMDRLAQESEALVLQGVEAARSSQQLAEHIRAMERRARLYSTLEDPDLLDSFMQSHSRIVATLYELGQLAATQEAAERLRLMQDDAALIVLALQTYAPGSDQMNEALARFPSLHERAGALSAINSEIVSRGLGTLQDSARRAQQSLAWQTATLIPVTLALLLLFVFIIGRPIRQIDRAISELGQGTFSRPISIRGPADLEALGRQLEWLRSRLLELAQEKNKFLRHMSHELKTPLANIREGTELLLDGAVGQLAGNQKEVTGILRDNGIRLQKLIENLLTFSAWQSQNAELNVGKIRLKQLVEAVVRQSQLALVAKNLTVQLTMQDISVSADRDKIRMVLDNLITNAIKFSPKDGTIYIVIRGDKDQAVIDVADEGPGIPSVERGRVFDAFYQGTPPEGGHVPGTGIGLSVVMECIHAHGGTVEILDGNYAGAQFRFRLPLEQAAVAA